MYPRHPTRKVGFGPGDQFGGGGVDIGVFAFLAEPEQIVTLSLPTLSSLVFHEHGNTEDT